MRNITSVIKGVAGRLITGLNVGGLTGKIGIRVGSGIIRIGVILGVGCNCGVPRADGTIRREIGDTVRGVANLRITNISIKVTSMMLSPTRWRLSMRRKRLRK